MLNFFSQLYFTLHHLKGTSNTVADALSRPSVVSPPTPKHHRQVRQVHDCGPVCAHRDVNLRRHGLHITVVCLLLRHDKDLLLDVRDFSGVEKVH